MNPFWVTIFSEIVSSLQSIPKNSSLFILILLVLKHCSHFHSQCVVEWDWKSYFS